MEWPYGNQLMTWNLFHRPQSIWNKLNVKTKACKINENQQPVRPSDNRQQKKRGKYFFIIFYRRVALITTSSYYLSIFCCCFKRGRWTLEMAFRLTCINRLFNSNHTQGNLRISLKRERYNQRPDRCSSKVVIFFLLQFGSIVLNRLLHRLP